MNSIVNLSLDKFLNILFMVIFVLVTFLFLEGFSGYLSINEVVNDGVFSGRVGWFLCYNDVISVCIMVL